jgi:hypothetical protein
VKLSYGKKEKRAFFFSCLYVAHRPRQDPQTRADKIAFFIDSEQVVAGLVQLGRI